MKPLLCRAASQSEKSEREDSVGRGSGRRGAAASLSSSLSLPFTSGLDSRESRIDPEPRGRARAQGRAGRRGCNPRTPASARGGESVRSGASGGPGGLCQAAPVAPGLSPQRTRKTFGQRDLQMFCLLLKGSCEGCAWGRCSQTCVQPGGLEGGGGAEGKLGKVSYPRDTAKSCNDASIQESILSACRRRWDSAQERGSAQSEKCWGLSRVWSSLPPLYCLGAQQAFACFCSDPELKHSFCLCPAPSTTAGEGSRGHGSTQEVTFLAWMRWEQRVKAQTEPVTVCRVMPSNSQPLMRLP